MCSWRGLFFSGLVVVLCGCTHDVSTQTCTKPDVALFYVSSPLPTTDPFSNTDTLGPGCFINPSAGNRVECHSAFRPILLDGVIGQKEGPPNISTISAWSRSQSTVSITFRSADVVQVRHIRLYFYNIQSMNIGLPEVTLMAGGPQDYHVTGNQHLNSIDSRHRKAILSYTRMVMTNTFEIIFGFNRTDIDWLLLSEVELCQQIDGSAQCTRNYSMSTNLRPDAIDVNTALPFCFIVPQSPIVKCELNNENVNNSATFPSGNNVAVMINDWIAVNVNNAKINSFKCEAGPAASAETYYATFYSLIPGNLVLFVNGMSGSYVEGTNISIVCRNFNARPAFQGAEIWTNSCGYVVGNRSLEFVATGDRAGLYTCSVPTVPAIPTLSYKVVVTRSSAQCPTNFTLSEKRNVAEIDVNTTMSFCFVIPLTPVHTCELNGIGIINSAENYITNLGYLVLNNWTSVSLNNGDINTLECDAGDASAQKVFYANFYSLSREILTTTTQHLGSQTCSCVPVAVIILSVTTGTSLVVITVLCAIIAYLVRRKKNIITEGTVYEIPKEANPESFNMTQSSVYGIHENRK